MDSLPFQTSSPTLYTIVSFCPVEGNGSLKMSLKGPLRCGRERLREMVYSSKGPGAHLLPESHAMSQWPTGRLSQHAEGQLGRDF